MLDRHEIITICYHRRFGLVWFGSPRVESSRVESNLVRMSAVVANANDVSNRGGNQYGSLGSDPVKANVALTLGCLLGLYYRFLSYIIYSHIDFEYNNICPVDGC